MAGEIQLNSVSLATESSGTITLNSSTDIKGCINASGSAPIYACRAWINFDGESASIGTGRANGNVSGVTDHGTAHYEIAFTTAMSDANYTIFCCGTKAEASGPYVTVPNTHSDTEYAPTTTSFRVGALVPGVSWGKDQKYVYCAVFR